MNVTLVVTQGAKDKSLELPLPVTIGKAPKAGGLASAIGGLASIGQSGTALGFAIMNGALARIGTSVLSAFGIRQE